MGHERAGALRRARRRIAAQTSPDGVVRLGFDGEALALLVRHEGRWALLFRFPTTEVLRANMPLELAPTSVCALGWATEELAAIMTDHWLMGEERPLPCALWDDRWVACA